MEEEGDAIIDLPLIGHITYREWHAVVDGFYCGVVGVREHEYGREKHYWRFGWLLGDMYRYLFRDNS